MPRIDHFMGRLRPTTRRRSRGERPELAEQQSESGGPGDERRLPVRWAVVAIVAVSVGIVTGAHAGLAAGLTAGLVAAVGAHQLIR